MKSDTKRPKIFDMAFARIYPLYIEKVSKKGKTKADVDTLICWLMGYDAEQLQKQLDDGVSVEAFFESAPQFNEHAHLITGMICGYRIEEIEDELMRKIRYLDKIIDELAKGKAMEKIMR